MARALELVEREGPALGLELNMGKCEDSTFGVETRLRDYLEAAENLSELFVRNDRPGEALEILNEQLRQPLPEASRLRLLARLASLEETSREEG